MDKDTEGEKNMAVWELCLINTKYMCRDNKIKNERSRQDLYDKVPYKLC